MLSIVYAIYSGVESAASRDFTEPAAVAAAVKQDTVGELWMQYNAIGEHCCYAQDAVRRSIVDSLAKIAAA